MTLRLKQTRTIDGASKLERAFTITGKEQDMTESIVTAYATEHADYNTTNFPRFVCHHGNWDIYANASGYCAAIPTAQATLDGCGASHFGDADYVRVTLGVDSRTPVNV